MCFLDYAVAASDWVKGWHFGLDLLAGSVLRSWCYFPLPRWGASDFTRPKTKGTESCQWRVQGSGEKCHTTIIDIRMSGMEDIRWANHGVQVCRGMLLVIFALLPSQGVRIMLLTRGGENGACCCICGIHRPWFSKCKPEDVQGGWEQNQKL